jgi:hypothetical protein
VGAAGVDNVGSLLASDMAFEEIAGIYIVKYNSGSLLKKESRMDASTTTTVGILWDG